MIPLTIADLLSFVLSMIFIFSLGYFVGKMALPFLAKAVVKDVPAPALTAKDQLRDLTMRIEMAEKSRQWYLKSVKEHRASVMDDLEIMVDHTIRAVGGFAIQQALVKKVAKNYVGQQNQMESLLESAYSGMVDNGMKKEDAVRFLEDEISILFFGIDVSNTLPRGTVLENPARNYFELRSNRS